MTDAFQRTAVGRADLARLLAALPSDSVASVAVSLGFERLPEPNVTIDGVSVDKPGLEPSSPDDSVEKHIPKANDAPTPKTVDLPFWRFEKMTFSDEPTQGEVKPVEQGLTEDDWTSPGRSLFATPPSKPLAPWSRLWPQLCAALQAPVASREPDVEAYVRAVSRGELVARMPYLGRRAWPSRLAIWIDRSARLGPFWSDQSEVCRRLRRVCDKSGLRVRLLDARTQARSIAQRGDLLAGRSPDAAEPVVVLGDLGVYGTDADRAAWRRTGRRLFRDAIRLSALVPSPPGRWSPFMRKTWNVMPWEGGRQRGIAQASVARTERLLKMVSPAAHVEPGLLREIRLLLPSWQADASTEADVWNHEDVRAADATGWLLRSDAAEKWRKAFANDIDPELKTRILDTIVKWHEHLPQEVLRAETLMWHGLLPEVKTPGNLQDALDFAKRLEASVSAEAAEGELSTVIKRFGRSFLAGMPEAIYAKVPALATIWVASFDEGHVPAGVDPIAIRARLERASETRHWAVRQVGRRLEFSPNERGPAWPSHAEGPGSPVAWLVAARPAIVIERAGRKTTMVLEKGLSLSFDPDESLVLRTDRCTVTIAPWRRESWMVAAGRDRFGLWADARIHGVVQRFRWIPPGRFLMGSPESETGRYNVEGPQHWVTWTEGRWLGDTPVTQALWKAVSGTNPSFFQGDSSSTDDRPVEMVRWNECASFVAWIGFRVSSEAEWEYACRAGTTTATWVGELEIIGDRDAPMLDAIAWYGGNSGVEFDLDKGYDTSSWPRKQYEFDRGGTRAVGKKAPNPFGLYDMLGNVHEWCSDVYGSYSTDAVLDPLPVKHTSATYVQRGGSWDSYARFVRAAYRNADPPHLRYFSVGVRLARNADVEPEKGDR